MNLPKTTLSWTYLKSLAPKIWSKNRQNNYSRLEFNKNDMKVGLYHQTHIEMATNFTADRLFGTKTFVDRARNRSQIFKSKKKRIEHWRPWIDKSEEIKEQTKHENEKLKREAVEMEVILHAICIAAYFLVHWFPQGDVHWSGIIVPSTKLLFPSISLSLTGR